MSARRALDSLFSTLKTYGSSFPVEFWDTVCQELLFPIFAVLKSSQDLSRFSTQEDMSVWLSSTMIQALRNLIDLYTFYFETLERFLDGLLDLLCVCICQGWLPRNRVQQSLTDQQKMIPWPALARHAFSSYWKATSRSLAPLVGNVLQPPSSSCFGQRHLISCSMRACASRLMAVLRIYKKLLVGSLDCLLYIVLIALAEPSGQTIVPAPLSAGEQQKSGRQVSLSERRRIFKQIIVKCVLQLLLIETTNDLLRNDEVYDTIPPEHLLRLMGVLDHSYQFARAFNEDKELRTGLWKVGESRVLFGGQELCLRPL